MGGMKFLHYGPSLWTRSINKKFHSEVWNFTVKTEQTRLLKVVYYMASDMQSARKKSEILHYLRFPSQFRQDNNILGKKSSSERIVKEEIRAFFSFSLFN